jgi:ATP-binding cassette subfamily F protein uup
MSTSTTTARTIIGVQGITHSYGNQPVLENISLTIHEGDRIGLIGRNGCGKSTLMKIFSGTITPDYGAVSLRQGIRVAMLGQQPDIAPEATIGEVLDAAARSQRACLDSYHAVMEKLAVCPPDHPDHAALAAESGKLHHRLDLMQAWDLDHEVKRVEVALALPPRDRTAATLSGGELRRVDLAAKLLTHPDLLLLDEPTNHIDTRSVEWIERFLEGYTGSCVLVTHDRYFLDRVVNRTIELEGNKVYSFPGNYVKFLEYKLALEEAQGRAESNRVALIRRELVWYRRAPQARGTKQKARIERFKEAQESGILTKRPDFSFEILQSRPLGKTILEARRIHFELGGRELVNDFSCVFEKGMRVGILGPNGAGKTTLLKLLMGKLEPRKGKVVVGDNTDFLYLDQTHEDVVPEQSILDYVSNGAKYMDVLGRRVYVPAYLEQFLFDKDTAYMPIGNLSGGERNRLDLIKKMLKGGNLLVLDEPTNDLDLYSLRVLEEAIEAFDGAALIVSHDRYFLNRLCTHIWVFQEDGRLVNITGNYEDYLLYLERRGANGEEAATPAAPERGAAKEDTRGAETSPKRKLNWQENKELGAMEETIHKAEAKVAELEQVLLQPGFYNQPHPDVQRSLDALNAAKVEVERLFARWAELEELRGK